jgi:hexosaminidase
VIPKGCAVKYSANVNNQALNPTLDETYALVNSVLTDIKEATNAKYLHLGGDEVVYGCWDVDPSIAEYMSANGIASNTDLFSQFILKVDDMAAKLGVTPIHWEDVFILGVKTAPNTIFNVWTNSVQIANVTSAGFKVIASPSNYWYLDHAANNWKVMYQYDPTLNLTADQAALILGGETSMWGEMVDQDNWFQKVWPTAAAVGERLWSTKDTTDLPDALNRLLVFRCRMQDRGYASTPIQPGFCGTTYV